jgi:hypothetical protein
VKNQARILDLLDRVPPFVVYYLARDSTAAYSHPGKEEIARRSGLSEATVMRLSRRLTWAGVRISDFETFCSACGVSFLKVSGKWNYITRPHVNYFYRLAKGCFKRPLLHLRIPQRKRFNELCEKWAEQMFNEESRPA